MHSYLTYSGQTVLVAGAARSGIAAAKFLLAQGARVVLTDKQGAEALSASIAPLKELARDHGELVLELGEHRPASFRACDLVVVSPGVPLSLPHFQESRAAGIPVIAEVELAWRHLKGRIIGITGSNGKTTTTMLTAAFLAGSGIKAYPAGNIGTALISYAEQSTPEDLFVTELSSFQLEAIHRFRPLIGALLNLTPDHLDRYAGFEEYAAAKARIFMNQEKTDYAVLNADDDRAAAMADRVPSTPFLFSRRHPVAHGSFVRGGNICFSTGESERILFPSEAVRLRGSHNVENVAAACTIALLAGAVPDSLEAVIRDFAGVEHRLEWVAEIRGVDYFNDSKATNVDAAIKSLEAFPGNIILIAGGRDKGGDFSALRSLACARVRRILLIGEAAGKICEALSGAVEMSEANTLPEAVAEAARCARPGDVVLLAPACASFDMFQNYEHRGRVFKAAVHALSQSS